MPVISREPSTRLLGALGRGQRRLFTTLIVIAVVLAALVIIDPASRLKAWLGGEDDNIASGTSVLIQIKETSQLTTATGQFSVPVFLEKESSSALGKLIPDILDGEQIVAVYYGSVDATINLQQLNAGNITADPASKTLKLTVPEPVLTDPNIDEQRSRVVAHNRGAFRRLDDAFNNTPLQKREALDQEAVTALRQAAKESALRETARTNARTFLENLGRNMGYETVTVEFTAAKV